ncbi:MAG: TIGR00730 family Rossman fold protein [Acidimicrobiales bacterium]
MPDFPPAVRRVCVFCASSSGEGHALTDATVALGRELAARDLELVYGGGAVGLMGLIADTVLEAGGRVTGVIPRNLFTREVGHTTLTRLEEVDSMHVRKARMYELADVFIALPGGFGTLEELAETLTWNQIGILQKPVGVLDVDGFWDPLLAQLDRMVDVGVLKPANRDPARRRRSCRPARRSSPRTSPTSPSGSATTTSDPLSPRN